MRRASAATGVCAVLAIVAAAGVAASPPPADLLPGIFTNDEQVRAARDAGAAVPAWTGLRITATAGGFRVEPIDAFGAATAAAETWRLREGADRVAIVSGACVREFAPVPAGLTIINRRGACSGQPGLTTATERGLAMTAADGSTVELQRARAFTCSVTTAGGAAARLPIFDAGGQAVATTAPRRRLLLRHLAWPLGEALPALALALLPESADAPLATATTDPGASRIGVAVQGLDAMCSLVAEAKMPG
jgi:hypothetical protein